MILYLGGNVVQQGLRNRIFAGGETDSRQLQPTLKAAAAARLPFDLALQNLYGFQRLA